MRISNLKAALLLLPVLLYGCTHQQPVADEPARLHAMPFNVVATGDSRASTFSWATGIEPVTGGLQTGNVSVNALLEEAIANTLQKKGYRYATATGQGDLLVSYAVAVNDAAADKQLAEKYGMQADLNFSSPEPDKFEKGTLVIDVVERQTGLSAWRSSLQGFAYLDINQAERRQRIHSIVQRMLSGLPARN